MRSISVFRTRVSAAQRIPRSSLIVVADYRYSYLYAQSCIPPSATLLLSFAFSARRFVRRVSNLLFYSDKCDSDFFNDRPPPPHTHTHIDAAYRFSASVLRDLNPWFGPNRDMRPIRCKLSCNSKLRHRLPKTSMSPRDISIGE